MSRLERIPWTDPQAPTETDLQRRLVARGFSVMRWTDPPGRTYAPHAHDHDESLWCVRGSIVFRIDGHTYPLEPGDRLELPRGTVHAAEAGADGATYLIGEKA